MPDGINGCRPKAARSRKNENRIDSEKSSCRPRVGRARDRDERMRTPRCCRRSGLWTDPHRSAGNGGSAAEPRSPPCRRRSTPRSVGTSSTPAVISGPAAVDNTGRAYTSSSAGGAGNGSAIGTNTNVNLIPKSSTLERDGHAVAGDGRRPTETTVITPAPAPTPVIVETPAPTPVIVETPAPHHVVETPMSSSTTETTQQ